MTPDPKRPTAETLAAFVEAACVPLDDGHATGSLDQAQRILEASPGLPGDNIHAAAIVGDDAAVLRLLALDPTNATARGGPRQWDALTHLCFSRYLRLDRSRSPQFVRAAGALLDAGANPNTGWQEENHEPHPSWEGVLYGAAGIAHDAALTRLLLERGADPNDDETVYHTPEGYDNEALRALVETGKLSEESLATLLTRKLDWHDTEAVAWLLDRGARPNVVTRWGFAALHHAVRRGNDREIIRLLLDHGADPNLPANGQTAAALAAWHGRGDVLALCAERGFTVELSAVERLLAACATNRVDEVRRIAASDRTSVEEIRSHGGRVLAAFAGAGNAEGVRHLLDLGIDVAARDAEGDGYCGTARQSTALHVAAWRARHAVVRLLLERGAPVNATDDKDRTPLQLAVRACVDSYWADRRSPDSVLALLDAGATVRGVPFPSGYPEADELLRRHGAA